MKSLTEFLTESKTKTIVVPEEKFFNKIAKGHDVDSPYRNPWIKILDGDDSVEYHIVPTGSTAWVEELDDEAKLWYCASKNIADNIKDEKVYKISTYETKNPSASINDTYYFPTFELMSERETKKYRTDPDPNANEPGMIRCNGNIGTFAQMFTDKNIKEVEKRLKKMGFEINYK